MEPHPVVMGGDGFTETTDHVSIGREVSTGKHLFKLSDNPIDRPHEIRKACRVQERLLWRLNE